MSNPQFPVLGFTNGGEDSKHYSVKPENTTLKTEMEGGYVISRARHTRAPRKTFATGYTGISDADKKLLEGFYAQVGGSAVIFDWRDPVDLVTYQVRFEGDLNFRYTGIGVSKLWDVQFQLCQA